MKDDNAFVEYLKSTEPSNMKENSTISGISFLLEFPKMSDDTELDISRYDQKPSTINKLPSSMISHVSKHHITPLIHIDL